MKKGKDKKKDTGPSPKNFKKVIRSFFVNIESIDTSFPLVVSILNARSKKEQTAIDKFIKDKKLPVIKKDGKEIVEIKAQNATAFSRLVENSYSAHLATHIVPKSLFVSLVSHFDVFLRDILKLLYKEKPEIFNSIEKQFQLSELQSFNTLSEAKEWIIDQEIDGLLRGSHPQLFKWLERNLKLDFKKDKDLWKKFIEIVERRNLFVHTNGDVTEQYLKVCKEHGVSVDSKIIIGKRLSLNDEYFFESLNTILELSIKLSHLIWRKIVPSEIEEADHSLNDIAYKLLCNGKYMRAIAILNILDEKDFKHFNEESKLTLIIDKAIALKFAGKKEASKKIISSYDWTARAMKFKLAAAILLDDNKKSEEIMKEIGKNKEFDKAYQEWPLFNQFRKKELFLKTYKKIYKKEFSVEKQK